jgi:hypothetical protein
LPGNERDLILPALEMCELKLGEAIDDAGTPIKRLYFPIDAAISVVNQQEGANGKQIVEVTIIGKEGCSGSTVVQGTDSSPSMALVQVKGRAIALPTSTVTRHPARLAYTWRALSLYSFLLYRHAVISVGCSQFHSPSQRIARWLSAHKHRTGFKSYPFTNAFFAAQVGLNEKIVSEVLDQFQAQHILELGFKNITILDQQLLLERSCPCFEKAKQAIDEYHAALQDIIRSHYR